ARVGVQQVGLVGALAELAQQQLHRNARAADDRLAQHDMGIDFDAAERHTHLPIAHLVGETLGPLPIARAPSSWSGIAGRVASSTSVAARPGWPSGHDSGHPSLDWIARAAEAA